MNFKTVLNERDQTPTANLQGSVLYQLLVQKQRFPLPEIAVLPDDFDFSLDREQQCPSIEEFEQYSRDKPLAGMPYGLPQISTGEFKQIEKWVSQGAPMAQPVELNKAISSEIKKWEKLLNGKDNKSQLISRYIYEHLFLAHLYFSGQPSNNGLQSDYFRLVRSKTPSGQAIDEIITRRPYDDPNVATFYYRLRRETATILTKTHMPYALNPQRKARWNELFYNHPFTVSTLPDYQTSSDPFITFAAIPANIRYQFMLDEAEFTIMGFIKGPVCRGQIALNVIRDKFWVFFVEPKAIKSASYDHFIEQQADNLGLPSNYSTTHLALSSWHKYAALEKNYIEAQDIYFKTSNSRDKYIGFEGIWKGNDNAALTIFRHTDNAEVVKGLQGSAP